jgi:hypothetical protein
MCKYVKSWTPYIYMSVPMAQFVRYIAATLGIHQDVEEHCLEVANSIGGLLDVMRREHSSDQRRRAEFVAASIYLAAYGRTLHVIGRTHRQQRTVSWVTIEQCRAKLSHAVRCENDSSITTYYINVGDKTIIDSRTGLPITPGAFFVRYAH